MEEVIPETFSLSDPIDLDESTDSLSLQVQSYRDYLEVVISHLNACEVAIDERRRDLRTTRSDSTVALFSRCQQFPSLPSPHLFHLDPFSGPLPRLPFSIASAHEPVHPHWDLLPAPADPIPPPIPSAPAAESPAGDPGWRDAAIPDDLPPLPPSPSPRGARRRAHAQMERSELRRRPDMAGFPNRVDVTDRRVWPPPRPRVLPRWAPRPYDAAEDVLSRDESEAFMGRAASIERERQPQERAARGQRQSAAAPGGVHVTAAAGDRTESSDAGDDFNWDWNRILGPEGPRLSPEGGEW
jgi:hypothetical protein